MQYCKDLFWFCRMKVKRRKRRCQQRRKIPKGSKTLGGDQQEQGSISATGKFHFVAGGKGVVEPYEIHDIFFKFRFIKIPFFQFNSFEFSFFQELILFFFLSLIIPLQSVSWTLFFLFFTWTWLQVVSKCITLYTHFQSTLFHRICNTPYNLRLFEGSVSSQIATAT